MTVDELIEKLQRIRDRFSGDRTIYYGPWGATVEELHVIDYVFLAYDGVPSPLIVLSPAP